MKKFILFLITITVAADAAACDICGCGVGSGYIGLLPEFRKKIVGLRYRYNAMYTHLGVGGRRTYLTTHERYTTLEAWAGWNLGKRYRVMASVPYGFNRKETGSETHRKNGLGDATLLGYYGLLNNRKSVGNGLLVQSLWAGGGVKLPTGKYNPADKAAGTDNANLFQLGSGSTDFLLSLMYDLRYQDAGINLASNYKLNFANRYDYRYANKLGLSAQAYYKWRVWGKGTVSPLVGAQYERSGRDRDGDMPVWASGGRLWLGTAGVETAIGRMAIGANWQSPLSQNLARGIVRAQDRVMVHVAVAL